MALEGNLTTLLFPLFVVLLIFLVYRFCWRKQTKKPKKPKKSNKDKKNNNDEQNGKLTPRGEVSSLGSDGTRMHKRRNEIVRELKISSLSPDFKERLKSQVDLVQHDNIVRYLDYEINGEYISIYMELCNFGNLYDVVDSQIPSELELSTPTTLKLMGETLLGLIFLHDNHIIHGDLKPENVMIYRGRNNTFVVKLMDMGISGNACLEKTTGSVGSGSGWQAPEKLDMKNETTAADMFSFGCVLYYTISKGGHPFGADVKDRDSRILRNMHELESLDQTPEAQNLIERLLNEDPDLRPNATQAHNHPLFWDPEKRLCFLTEASDHINVKDAVFLNELETVVKLDCGSDWSKMIHSHILKHANRYRRTGYDYSRVDELLRLIRNTKFHYEECSKRIKKALGGNHEGIEKYYACRFQDLLVKVYTFLEKKVVGSEFHRRHY